MQTAVPRHVLPVLVTAQFAGTSLWFAVNAVMPDLQRELVAAVYAGHRLGARQQPVAGQGLQRLIRVHPAGVQPQ